MAAPPLPDDGTDPLRTSSVAVDLTGRGALAVAGPDAAQLLHGLVTNDVNALAPGAGCHAALLTPKGRMRAEMAILRLSADDLLLDCDPGLARPLAAILASYLPFSRSTLEDRSASSGVVHVEGPGAPAVLDSSGLPAPGVRPFLHVEAEVDGLAVRVVRVSRAGSVGFDVRSAGAEAGRLLRRLVSHGARLAAPDVLEAGRIEAGIPRWGAEMDETVLPNEVGLERTAISYTKGCYLGQETVARLRTYGHVNRHLVAVLLPRGGSAAPGDAVLAEGEPVGKVTSAVDSAFRGHRVALACVSRGREAPGTRLSVATEAGAGAGVVAAIPLAS